MPNEYRFEIAPWLWHNKCSKKKIRILQNAVPGGPIVLAPFMSCSPTELITKGMPNQGMGIHMSNPVLSIVSNATISPPHLHHIWKEIEGTKCMTSLGDNVKTVKRQRNSFTNWTLLFPYEMAISHNHASKKQMYHHD